MIRANLRLPVAKEGIFFILPLAIVSIILWIVKINSAAVIFSLLTIFVVYFFRDPERLIPGEEKAILSPADGRIIQVDSCVEERFLKGPALKVSIFMSLFDVHINRIPFSGKIVDLLYQPGKFFRANLPKASVINEQNTLFLEAADGTRLVFIQIAGLIARRIICWVRRGDEVTKGQRFGLIAFGSRVDLYLPAQARLVTQIGQKVLGGQSILGFLP